MFEQYAQLKAKYPDALLLVRIGDFYQAFDEDADTLARVLGLSKTTSGSVRMAGFPSSYLQCYTPCLLEAGLELAVADPLDTLSSTQVDVRSPEETRGL